MPSDAMMTPRRRSPRRGRSREPRRALEARIGRSAVPADASGLLGELARLYESHLGRMDDAFELRLRALELDPRADATHEAAHRLATSGARRASRKPAAGTTAPRACASRSAVVGSVRPGGAWDRRCPQPTRVARSAYFV